MDRLLGWGCGDMNDTLNLENFPCTQALSDRRRAKFAEQIERLRGFQEGQPFAAAHLKDLKGSFSSAFDDVWKLLIGDRCLAILRRAAAFGRVAEEDLKDLYYGGPSGLHTVTAVGKRVAKFQAKYPDHEIGRNAAAIIREFAAIAAAVDSLKGKESKRQPRAAEPGEEGFIPPLPSTAAEAAVRDALMSITEKHKKLLFETLAGNYTKWCEDFDKKERSRMARVASGEESASNRRDDGPPRLPIMQKTFSAHRMHKAVFYLLNDGYRDVILKEAGRDADFCQQVFVYKNLSKLASIVDAKVLSGVEIIGSDLRLDRIEGRLRVTFDDGSSFEANNSVVLSRSVLGNPFLRHPLTFHEVILADGSRMSQPSYEKMHDEFLTTTTPACGPTP